MALKIKLYFETFKEKALEGKIKNNEIVRLNCFIKFKTADGWTAELKAIVDTGAHTTLIPLSIWRDIEFESIMRYKIRGLANREECAIPVIIGRVRGIMVDEFGHQTRELNILSYLALSDKTPLIVGFKDLMERYDIYFSYRKGNAYIEI